MGKIRHGLALMLAGIAMPAAAGPIESYEAAIARGEYREAAKAADALIAARLPTDGKPRPDPFLNGVVGRLLLMSGGIVPARAYLEKAQSPEFSPFMAVEVALGRAEAQGRDGDWAAALASYRAVPDAALDGTQRRRRDYGIARQLLLDAPAEAIPLLTRQLAASPAPADRWEGELLLAFAQRLSGDKAAAQAAADRAWIAAASARADDEAPLNVALGRAALAADAANVDTTRAMLAFAGGQAVLSNGVAERLPVCGENGIRADDYAVFAVRAGRSGSISTIAATSRPDVAPVFARAIGQTDILDPAATGGTVFTAHCRTLPVTSYRGDSGTGRVWAAWSEKNGFFPTMMAMGGSEDINLLSDRIGTIEARFGKSSPFTIMPRQELLPKLALQAERRGDASRVLMRTVAVNLVASIRAHGGLEEVYPPAVGLRQMQDQLSGAPELTLAARRSVLRDLVTHAGLDNAYWLGTSAIDGDAGLAPAEKIALIDQLLARFPVGVPDRRVAALKMRKGDILIDSGQAAAGRALFASMKLPSDVCMMMDEQPQTKIATIDAEDYPAGPLRSGFAGSSVVEYGVDANGRVQHLRHVLSAPAGLFDAAVETSVKAFTFSPARRKGHAAACGPRLQRVIWNLPERPVEGAETFDPLSLSETR